MRQSPSLHHVLHHRWTMCFLALGILLDNTVVLGPLLAAIHFIGTVFDVPQHVLLVPSVSGALVVLGWNFAWLDQYAPVFSRLFWGRTVYVFEDASGHLGLTTEIGVVEHPHVDNAVEAVIPGILFLAPAELRQYKPRYTHVGIPWTIEAIKGALQRRYTDKSSTWN